MNKDQMEPQKCKDELLPCPWCGNQPKEDISIKQAEPVYSCCVTEYMSKERWNTRFTRPEPVSKSDEANGRDLDGNLIKYGYYESPKESLVPLD